MYFKLNLKYLWNFESVNAILLALFFALLLIYWYYARKVKNYWANRGISSPPATPLIGNFLSLSTPLPILFQNYFKQFGGVFGVHFGPQPILVICEPELIKRVMVKDFHLFRNRAEMPRHRLHQLSMFFARDDEWKRLRSILTPTFTAFKLKKLEGLMQKCVDTLVGSFDKQAANVHTNSFDARDYTDNYAMDVIGKSVFATDTIEPSKPKCENVFIKMTKLLLAPQKDLHLSAFILRYVTPDLLFNKFVHWKVEPFYAPEVEFFENLTRHLIRERKKNCAQNYDDLLQLLVNAEECPEKGQNRNFKNLTEEEIGAQMVVLVIAGYETSAFTLSHCLYELAVNPTVQEQLYNEIQLSKSVDPSLSYSTVSKLDYLDAVISETLRLYPPGWILNRVASGPLYIEEFNLKFEKNDELVVPVYAIHRCEKYFPNPDQFCPERFMPQNCDKLVPYTYLPFGVGPRNCIGMRFALTEAKMALAQIVDRFEIVRTGQTPDKLKILKSMSILATEPTVVGVRRRTESKCLTG